MSIEGKILNNLTKLGWLQNISRTVTLSAQTLYLEIYVSSSKIFNSCCISDIGPLTNLLFQASTLYICLIFETFRGLFYFKYASMFFGATMFNVMSETSSFSFETCLNTMGWSTSLLFKAWLCILEITLHF